MAEFIKGRTLSRRFFNEIAKPVLDEHFPTLQYSAGLLGYGSDVLGFDDATSTDHMWGPRFYLFLNESDISKRDTIMEVFSRTLPHTFLGYSVHFSAPDPNDGGVRHAQFISEGPVSPLIFIHTPEEYLTDYLGTASLHHLSAADWLSFSEHRLLALSCAEFYKDDLHMAESLSLLQSYPKEVRMYLIASNWSLLAEEQAFVKRCSVVGDEMGSILVCGRIAERLMRLCFLYCSQYAPYSKWFGTAFERLPVDASIKNTIHAALTASDISARETHIALAQKLVADLHNSLSLTEFVEAEVQSYFGRDIQVIYADNFAAAAEKELAGTELEGLPLIGTLSEVANFTVFSDDPQYRTKIKKLYM